MERFSLTVRPAVDGSASLVVTGAEGTAGGAFHFRTRPGSFAVPPGDVLFAADVTWGGLSNPLFAALPEVVEFEISDDDDRDLARLIASELRAERCGSGSVVNRLCEVLVVRMLRRLIEAGSTEPGLLAGLSDPRLSRAIVAIHDHPDRQWQSDDLANIAGMSLSRFSEVFTRTVGQPPMSYLRQWRLTLARQDVARGERIQTIARRYGYGSTEGFARAFRGQFGENPVKLRPRAAVS